MKKKNTLVWVAASFLGFACAMTPVGDLDAQEDLSSSACMNCHTDFEEMDSYGAASASSSAAIAG